MSVRPLFLLLISLWVTQATAVQLTPEVLTKLRESGKLGEFVATDRDARARGLDQPILSTAPLLRPRETDTTTYNCIVILCQFTDHYATQDTNPPARFEQMLFSRGTFWSGSMRDYYLETSYGQFQVTGMVTVWLTLNQTYAYYVNHARGFGSYPQNAQKLAEDAVLAADPVVDYSIADNNHDGTVDALIIVHAGHGYESSGDDDDVHSHFWHIHDPMDLDGVRINGYTMQPEFSTMGVFAHEFGHNLGLPDLYDTDYSSSGLDKWSIMAGGSWIAGGIRPGHFDIWSRSKLGFIAPILVTDYYPDAPFPPIENAAVGYRLNPSGITGPEYYMVEYRARTLFDRDLPGSGLLLYHIDENARDNSDETHYKVALIQADNRMNLEGNAPADEGDPYPGITDNRGWDRTTHPYPFIYAGTAAENAVWDVRPGSPNYTADLLGSFCVPRLDLLEVRVREITGDMDLVFDPDEQVELSFSVKNEWLPLPWSNLSLIDSTGELTILDGSSRLSVLGTGDTADNFTFPFRLYAPPTIPEGTRYSLTVLMESGFTLQLPVQVGRRNMLLVDDDDRDSLERYFTGPLTRWCVQYDVWDVARRGVPSAGLIEGYGTVIWFTGNNAHPSFGGMIESFPRMIAAGHRLCVTGEDAPETLDSLGLLSSIFGATLGRTDVHIPYVDGIPGTPLVEEDSCRLVLVGGDGAWNQTSSSAVEAGDSATLFFRYVGATSQPGAMVGWEHQSGARTLLCGFGLEAVGGNMASITRREIVHRILDWFGVPNDVPSVSYAQPSTDLRLWPNPARGVVNLRSTGSSEPLEIRDLLGGLVAKLPPNGTLWDGRDRMGRPVQPGIYLVGPAGKKLVWLGR